MWTIQEKNIQGHTIIGTIFADICQDTDYSETFGLQDNDVLVGNGGDDFWAGKEMTKYCNAGNDAARRYWG